MIQKARFLCEKEYNRETCGSVDRFASSFHMLPNFTEGACERYT